MIKNTKNSGGYVLLMSVLIIGAIGAAIAISVVLSGLASSQTNSTLEQSSKAKALADACAEEALQLIRESPTFTGSGSITTGNDSCDYIVTSQADENRTIRVSGSVSTVVRKSILSVTQINPSIVLTSWQEVADF